MGRFNTLIIVPAFNEERTIGAIVSELLQISDVLVVDDGSTDDTAKICKENGCRVISLPENVGYEKALDFGLNYKFDYQFVITTDGDGEIPVESVQTCINKLLNGYDLVLGCRSRFPRFAEYLVNKFFCMKYNHNDILCGLKGYRVTKMTDNLTMVGSAGTAMAFSMIKKDSKVSSVSIVVKPREGVSRFGGNDIRTNLKLLKVLKYL